MLPELPLEEELLLEELELLPEELSPLEEEELVPLAEEVAPLDEEEGEEVVPLEELPPFDDALPVLTPPLPPLPPLPPSPGAGVPHEQTARVPRNPTPSRNDPRLRTTKGACRMSNAEREDSIALLRVHSLSAASCIGWRSSRG
jgi:hypothetical protein